MSGPRLPSRRAPRGTIVAVIAVAVAVVVVTSIAIESFVPRAGGNHMICLGKSRVGNVTAWYPYAFAASPFGGSETGQLRVWTNYTVAGHWRNLTASYSTFANLGNVTLVQGSGGNWTIYTAQNRTVSGPGSSYPCG